MSSPKFIGADDVFLLGEVLGGASLAIGTCDRGGAGRPSVFGILDSGTTCSNLPARIAS